MVFRSVISAVVFKLPYSDRMPSRIKSMIKEDDFPLANIEIPPTEVRPLVSPAEKIRIRMLERRTAECKSKTMSRDYENEGDDTEDGDETLRELESDSYRSAMIEQYLNEQSDEFNSLINRNLKEVMRQQEELAETASWHRLILELALSRTSDEATSRVNSLMNKASDAVYSYVPFIRNERNTTRILDDYYKSDIKSDTVAILDPLDYDSKVALLKQLMVDLGVRADADDVINFSRGVSLSEDATVVDKIELLTLLSVRLWFIGLKYFIPISKLLYTKFKQNDIVLINNKNFSKFLTVLVRSMEALEEKLNSPKKQPAQEEV